MQLYKTANGHVLWKDKFYLIKSDWDQLINQGDLYKHLNGLAAKAEIIPADKSNEWLSAVQAPIASQEVWAAGVTYLRSRDARKEESKESGGADFYQKVYDADRPELFFKALPHRVSGPNQEVFIRKDSTWNVPEPELTLFINSRGSIQAYTVGNDMSSRSIEGENPLYLPQAKSYEKSCALGPCLYVPSGPITSETGIHMHIERNGAEVFKGSIKLNKMKRTLPELAGWLYKECIFPNGCFLMTGTGLVPDAGFTLQPGDMIHIAIDGIGILQNRVNVMENPMLK